MPVQKVYLLNQNTPVIIPSGLVPKGAYNGATDYAVGDTVDYLGSSYVMHVDAAAGTLPTDTTKWQVLAEKGDKGDTGATGAAGVVQAVTDGAGIDVDSTDPASPIVSLDPASIASLALADSAVQNLSDLSITSTAAELNYTDGVTSAIQTQLDGKSATSHTHTAADTTDFDTEVSNNTDVAANTAARHTHANSAVLDATTASFTTADETKLDGIAIGAQVNTVTSVNTRTGAVTGLAEASDLTAHTGNTSNPHSVTKAQVGLGNVDNTSDVDKPVSTATQTALDGKLSLGGGTTSGPVNYSAAATGTGFYGQGVDHPSTSKSVRIGVYHAGAYQISGLWGVSTPGNANYILGTTGSDTYFNTGTAGSNLIFQTGSGATKLAIVGSSGAVMPGGNLTQELGSSSFYWSNLYAQRHYFNSTAYIDGSTAGQANIVATNLAINGANGATGTFTSQDGKTVTVNKGIIVSIT